MTLIEPVGSSENRITEPIVSRRSLTFLLIFFCLGFSTLHGENRSLLERIDPQVAQRSTTVELIGSGTSVEAPLGILFYRPGIELLGFEPLAERIDSRSGKLEPADPGTRFKIKLKIAADCGLGEHPLRLRTRNGISELVSLYVTALPIVDEVDPYGTSNDTPDHAQTIPMNCSVWGRQPHGKPQDHDYYAVDLVKGQRLSIEVVADRLGTFHYAGMNDPAIAVYGPNGKRIARDDDNSVLITDPRLSIIAPENGKYTIHYYQQMDYETSERPYILHVGTWAQPNWAFPLGGQAGKSMNVRMCGDPGGNLTATINLPAEDEAWPISVTRRDDIGGITRDASDGGFMEYTPTANPAKSDAPTSPTPLRVRVAKMKNAIESEPNNDVSKSSVCGQLPVAMNGFIDRKDDVDCFRFSAKKGDIWFVRTYAASVGSALDARIWIHRADNGKRVKLEGSASGGGGNQRMPDDDSTWEGLERYGHSYRHQIQDRLDPHVVFKVPVDGDYVLSVADTRGQHGWNFPYRIEFHPWREKLFTYLPQYPSMPRGTRDAFVAARGTFTSHPVSIQKGLLTNYQKPLRVRAVGLPTGVKLHAPTLYPGQTEFLVLLETKSDAPLAAALVDLVLEPIEKEGDRVEKLASTFKQTVVNTQRRGDFAMHFVFLEQAALAVVDKPPFRLKLGQPGISLAKNGELTLQVDCVREKSFTGAVYCEMDWLPPGINKQPPLIIPAGESTGEYRLNAISNARPGEYRIAITGRQNEGGYPRDGVGVDFVSSNFIDLNVADPYVNASLARSSVERTKQATIQCTLDHNRKLPGEALATLRGLPAGVTVVKPLPRISSDTKNIEFKIQATNDALLGQYKNIFCEITIVEDGQEIRQQTGAGTLRIDAKRGSK